MFLATIPFPAQTDAFSALVRRAAEARDAGRLEDALEFYGEGLKLKPDWEEGWWNAGSIAYDLNRYAECAPDFHRLAALKPDLAPAWTMAGLCEYRLRDFDSALHSLRTVEHLGFKENLELSKTARLHLGLVLTKTGNFETALPVLAELTRFDKKTPEISAIVGIAGLRQPWLPAEVPEASRDLVLKLGDAMATAMELDYKGAIEKFQSVEKAYPADANVHFRFGAYLIQNDPDRGIAEIRKALSLDPGHLPALVGLAVIYLDRDDPKSAIEFAQKAVQAGPGEFSTHVALGRTLLGVGDAAGAVKELELAVKLAPENATARFNLASAYARVGNNEGARREREEFKRLKLIDSPVK